MGEATTPQPVLTNQPNPCLLTGHICGHTPGPEWGAGDMVTVADMPSAPVELTVFGS